MTQAQTELAESETVEGLRQALMELRDKYRLYSKAEPGSPEELVGVYESLEDAKERMWSISYDCQPDLFFYIAQGDDVVFGRRD